MSPHLRLRFLTSRHHSLVWALKRLAAARSAALAALRLAAARLAKKGPRLVASLEANPVASLVASLVASPEANPEANPAASPEANPAVPLQQEVDGERLASPHQPLTCLLVTCH